MCRVRGHQGSWDRCQSRWTGTVVSPTGTGAGAIRERKLTVTGCGSLVTICVSTPCDGRLQQKGNTFIKQHWFSTIVVQRWVSLKVFEKIDRWIVNATLRGHRSRANSVDLLCVVRANFANEVNRICQTFINTIERKPVHLHMKDAWVGDWKRANGVVRWGLQNKKSKLFSIGEMQNIYKGREKKR